MCTSQHAFKDTLYCAHIPLNVPKGAQAPAQLESLERGIISLEVMGPDAMIFVF